MPYRLACLSFTLVLVGCGAAATEEDETLGASAEAVSTGTIAGAYVGSTGAQYANIVLASELDAAGHYAYFIEELGGRVSCVVGKGCTVTHDREDGYYSATATHLTVHPTGGAERVYTYARHGGTLTLSRKGVEGSYAAIASYCDTPADCPDQGLIRPECASATSGWECNASACSYACSGAR